MKRVLIGTAAALLATVASTPAFAQSPTMAPAASVYTAAAKAQWDMIKVNIAKTAAKVAPENYAFKPTPDVRSLGEILGHVADANFMICGAAAGEKPAAGGFEKKTDKAEIVKGVNDSIAYCDKVIASLDDTKGAATVQFFTGPTPKLAIINFNVGHCNEHYGNLVTYMRLKGIVPPSSEPTK
jgi:uncharacterized damage-inducible protein DinB